MHLTKTVKRATIEALRTLPEHPRTEDGHSIVIAHYRHNEDGEIISYCAQGAAIKVLTGEEIHSHREFLYEIHGRFEHACSPILSEPISGPPHSFAQIADWLEEYKA